MFFCIIFFFRYMPFYHHNSLSTFLYFANTDNEYRLGAFKIQSHLMFFDTAHNSTRTVLDTLRGAFAETARKMWAYIRCMPQTKRPRHNLIIRKCNIILDCGLGRVKG